MPFTHSTHRHYYQARNSSFQALNRKTSTIIGLLIGRPVHIQQNHLHWRLHALPRTDCAPMTLIHVPVCANLCQTHTRTWPAHANTNCHILMFPCQHQRCLPRHLMTLAFAVYLTCTDLARLAWLWPNPIQLGAFELWIEPRLTWIEPIEQKKIWEDSAFQIHHQGLHGLALKLSLLIFFHFSCIFFNWSFILWLYRMSS